MSGQSGAAVVSCSGTALKGAVTVGRGGKPSEAVSLGLQSRVCVLILRQVVCVASVSSVVTATPSLPPVCQKYGAACSVSSVWLLKKPSTEQQTGSGP